jgi:adenylate cyclase
MNLGRYYSWEKLEDFTRRHFNPIFLSSVFIILFIFYLLPQKMAVLNFFYIVVILTGYYKKLIPTLLYATVSIILVSLFLFFFPVSIQKSGSGLDFYFQLYFWAISLILTGGTVSILQDKLRVEIDNTKQLNIELNLSATTLNALKGKVEETLYSTMDATVAKLMIEDRLRNEKHHISVLFSDLVGYTDYSEERSPEIVVRDLNNYIMLMESVILKYRGHIDKYLGDGIMCEFGAPIDYERSRLLSVVSALKMHEALRRYKFPWEMRIGIAYGTAVTGLIGVKRQSYTSIGDVVNLASRIEKSCPSGSILVNDATHEEIKRFFDTRLYRDSAQQEPGEQILMGELDQLCSQLKAGCDSPDLYLKIGRIYLSFDDPFEALKYLNEGLAKYPDNNELKVAFAEATLKSEAQDKLHVKGRLQGVMIYEVLDFKDIRFDNNKFTESFLKKYPRVDHLIEMPDDVILPIEALDGCIRHSLGVAHFTFAVATELNLTEAETARIIQAAYLADIGKEVIPHHILNIAGGLNDREIDEIRKHPEAGARILKTLGYEDPLMLRCVLHSHECYNGSGYPEGLPGNDIPLGARIISVCDTYNALTSWRPYREAWSRESALTEIKLGTRKGLFDPQVVNALIKALS